MTTRASGVPSRPTPPPGALWDGQGVRFTLRSRAAEGVELCLFDDREAPHESDRISLDRVADDTWSTYLETARPGHLYGYRVHGPWAPDRGHRFDAAKLLIDPAARALCGDLVWDQALQATHPELGEAAASGTDSAPFVPRSVVVDGAFDWGGDRPPDTAWRDTLIYECHVRGMTRLHPGVPEELRGTYLGLCQGEVVQHLLNLGVTTVELLPVQQSVSEPHLQRLGLSNYFGYNPLGFFAPHAGYATGDRGQQVVEFKTLVKTLHAAGLEILLDVVFNHTAEGNQHGPTLSLRGIDNRRFYRLREDDQREYLNFTGCGNTLHFGHEEVVELVLSCLRYWVDEMHVDGFRFDLAPVLGRTRQEFDPEAGFFTRLRADPILSRIKFIAEPWDLGPNGYRLGQFPSGWCEWNDRYRDTVRGYWRGEPDRLREMIRRVGGSQDIFGSSDCESRLSINFVTSHDGFTLHDLVSYERKHNWDNGEHNQDGHDHNLSRNWGTEGPTQDAEILALREQMKRNFLATLACSRGVPMLSHGDEMGRTQRGNNNAYCQDNELTWMPWGSIPAQQELLDLTRQLFALRAELDVSNGADGRWISAHGAELSAADFRQRRTRPFGWLVEPDCHPWLVIFNADDRGHLFELPDSRQAGRWRQLLNTARPGTRLLRGRAVRLPAHALLLLRFEPAPAEPR